MLSKKEVYNQANRIMEQRRQTVKVTAQNHIIEISMKIPEIARLKRHLNETSIRLTKAILSGETRSIQMFDVIRDDNLKSQAQIRQLLQSNGYPESYLEENPFCALCNDFGILDNERCSCFKKLVNQISIEDLQKSSPLKLCQFSSFRLDYYPNAPIDNSKINPQQHMRRILNYCADYAEHFSISAPGLFMLGNTGLGKTHLSLAIASKVIECGFNVIYISTSDLMRRINAQYFNKKDQAGEDVLELVTSTDLLIIDDLGAEFESSFNTATLYDIINARTNKHLPTIINSNLPPAELEKRYSARIVSRLFTLFNCLNFVGHDIRMISSDRKRN